MKICRFLVAGMLCMGVTSVEALMPQEMTEAERQALPPWCEFTQSFDRATRAPGHYYDHVARYGHGWTHVHHFCWAFASLLRYHRYDTSAQMKRTLARSALSDMDHVLRNAPEDFILRFDIMARKARVLVMIGELSDAEALSETIRSKWPERADSYGLAAEVLLALNRRGDANDVLSAAEERVGDKARLGQIRSALGL